MQTSIALLFVAFVAASLAREEVNFNFGWRFHLGIFEDECDANSFPRNLTGKICMGLAKSEAASSTDCRYICCLNSMCAIWLFSETEGCWVGQSDDCSKPSDSWVGEGRDIPAPLSDAGPTSKTFDDSSWDVIDVPHDALIAGKYDESAPMWHGYLPANVTWYRKHFNLPSEWKGRSVWVYFEGVFRASTTYLNGQRLLYHDSGYTSFSVRLDNASHIAYGDGKENENVLAVVANPGYEYTGWWYEGGGIYRNTYIVSTSPVHIVVNSVYGPSKVLGGIGDHDPNDFSKGQYADVEFYPLVEVVNEQDAQLSVMVRFDILDDSNNIVGTVTSQKVAIESEVSTKITTTISKISKVELWSTVRPYMYQMNVTVIDASSQSIFDSIQVSIGARKTIWDPNKGFYLNDKHFTWRGFNNHNHFSGVGVAVPNRINLFRGQMMRAVGANSWRMSHNPPLPKMLDILDHLGIVVWDENRNFGDNPLWIQSQRDMVRRDRNHPSVMIWSFCNEAGCSRGDTDNTAVEFTKASKEEDPYRPVSANMNGDIGNTLSKTIDVQGFSHRQGNSFDQYHQQFPQKPLIGSECCSCKTQRGEDVPGNNSKYGNFNALCSKQQTEWQLNRTFVAGCMVWTLFDYYGPDTDVWPLVTTVYGSIDLSGFAKASAYWYRTWWYCGMKKNSSSTGYDVPVNSPRLVDPYVSPSLIEEYIVHIVQKWEPSSSVANRTIQVYTNAPLVELIVNGKSQGSLTVLWQGWAEWHDIPFAPGKITAMASNSVGVVVATHTVETAGIPYKVVASIDVPSVATGTGTALVLDGEDAGLVSAAIVDAQGRVVPSASHNVTFSIVSGPGRIIGVGNGDAYCHEPNKVSWRSAFHGLTRAVVQVTENSASSPMERRRMIQIDRDGGSYTSIIHPDHGESSEAEFIVVKASVEGLEGSTVSIPLSSDTEKFGVLAIARKSLKALD